MVEFRITWQKFWTPLSELQRFLWPASRLIWTILTPLHLISRVLLRQWGNVSTPLKRNVKNLHPPKAGLQIFLTFLTSRPSPTAGLKMTNPLPNQVVGHWLSCNLHRGLTSLTITIKISFYFIKRDLSILLWHHFWQSSGTSLDFATA